MASKETVNSHDESIIIEVDDSPAAAPRKSTRKSPWEVVDDDCTKLCEFPVGQSDTVTVSSQDYASLEHDTFLNDIIIDFYLTHLFYNVLPAEFRNSVHIFSTMFYKRLLQTPKKGAKKVAPFETDPSLSAKEKQHLRVAGWTKNVDLFSKDVVIIPICENSHWYLVVVIKPGLVNIPEDSEKMTDTQEDSEKMTDIKEDSEKKTDSQEDSEKMTDTQEDSKERTDILRDSSNKTDNSEEKTAKGEPFFLVLDSLGGTKRSAVTNIQEYLACEWRSKKCCGDDPAQELQFPNAQMPTIHPRKPEQENWSDCGIFLLHYVEKIFQKLDNFLWTDLPDLAKWFTSEEVGKKRAAIAVLIRKLAKEQVKRGETPNFPSIKFKSESRTRKSPKLMDSSLAEKISPIRDVNENLHHKEIKGMKVTRSISSKQVTAKSTYSKKNRQEKSSKCSKTSTIAFKETETGSSDPLEDFTFDPSIYSRTTTMCSDKPVSSSNTATSSIATPSISSNTASSSSHIAATSATPSHAAAMSSTSSTVMSSISTSAMSTTSSTVMSSTSSTVMSTTSSAATSDGNPSNSSSSNLASGAKANFMEVWNANKDNLVIGDYVRFASTAKKDEKVKKKRLGLETFKSLQLSSTDGRNTSLNNRSYAPEKYTDK